MDDSIKTKTILKRDKNYVYGNHSYVYIHVYAPPVHATLMIPASETTHEAFQVASGSGLSPTDQNDDVIESSDLGVSSTADNVTGELHAHNRIMLLLYVCRAGTEVLSQFPVTMMVIIALVLGVFCLFSVIILAIGIQYYV